MHIHKCKWWIFGQLFISRSYKKKNGSNICNLPCLILAPDSPNKMFGLLYFPEVP